MIDFIKITNVWIDPEIFLNSPYLNFSDKVSRKTGEIINGSKVAKYRGNRFIISCNGSTGIAGSLHMYYNNGHNHDDFTLGKLRWVIKDLKTKFGIKPEMVILNNVEIGLNLEVPFDPDDFIKSLVTYKNKSFNIHKEKNMTFSEVEQSQYILKIYNKGLQYGLNKNILRIEVKITRMAKLNKFGIKSLSDLIDPIKLQSLKSVLLDVFSDITFWDNTIDKKSLNPSDKELLENGYNPKFWQDLHDKDPNNSSRKLRLYQDLVRKHSKKKYHLLAQQINSKWDSLILNAEEPIREITGLETDISPEPIRDFTGIPENIDFDNIRDFTTSVKTTSENKIREITTFENPSSDNEIRDFTGIRNFSDASIPEIESDSNTSSYNLTIGKNLVSSISGKRECIVTGLDISMQKEESRFLSISGIRYYNKNNPEIFQKLKSRLTKNWQNCSLDKQIFEIAHSIRNSHHSKRIHTQKAIKRLKIAPSLFNVDDLISEHKKSIANR